MPAWDEHPVKTTPLVRGTTPEIQQAARKLRRQLTPAEHQLWEAIRKRQVAGLRFRCQHPVGLFILDFYCPALKLVVEVDGGIHDTEEQALRDEARTAHLEGYGYHVLRFRNEEVLQDLSRVLRRIETSAQGLCKHTSEEG